MRMKSINKNLTEDLSLDCNLYLINPYNKHKQKPLSKEFLSFCGKALNDSNDILTIPSF